MKKLMWPSKFDGVLNDMHDCISDDVKHAVKEEVFIKIQQELNASLNTTNRHYHIIRVEIIRKAHETNRRSNFS